MAAEERLRRADPSDGEPDNREKTPKAGKGRYGSPPPLFPDNTGADPSHIPSNNNPVHNARAWGAISSDESGYDFDPSSALPWSSKDVYDPGVEMQSRDNRSTDKNKSKPKSRRWDLLIDGS